MEEKQENTETIKNEKSQYVYETSFVCEHHIKDDSGNIVSSQTTTLHENLIARNMVDAYRGALRLIAQLKKVDPNSTFFVENIDFPCSDACCKE